MEKVISVLPNFGLGPILVQSSRYKVISSTPVGGFSSSFLEIFSINDSLRIRGGLVGYGEINNQCVLLKGSVPGSKKRLIILRPAIRNQKKLQKPIVNMVSVRSQQ